MSGGFCLPGELDFQGKLSAFGAVGQIFHRLFGGIGNIPAVTTVMGFCILGTAGVVDNAAVAIHVQRFGFIPKTGTPAVKSLFRLIVRREGKVIGAVLAGIGGMEGQRGCALRQQVFFCQLQDGQQGGGVRKAGVVRGFAAACTQ